MCPVCIVTLALVAAGAASTGGLTALALKFNVKTGTKEIAPAIQTQGGQDESIPSSRA